MHALKLSLGMSMGHETRQNFDGLAQMGFEDQRHKKCYNWLQHDGAPKRSARLVCKLKPSVFIRVIRCSDEPSAPLSGARALSQRAVDVKLECSDWSAAQASATIPQNAAIAETGRPVDIRGMSGTSERG